MIRCGDTVTLEIIETNMLGNGVAKVDNMVVFCHGAVEGDRVVALVTDVKKNYAEAKCLRIVTPSEHRVSAACPVAAECGGCVFDGVSYAHECEVKRRGIESALRREGIRAGVSRFVGTECSGYRNKAVFHFNDEGKCGFFSAGTKNFTEIEKCVICDEKINIIKNEVERIVSEDDDIIPGKLTYLYIRYMKETDEASVVIGYTGEADLSPFAKQLAVKLPYVRCVMRGRAESPEAKDERFELLSGSGFMNAVVAGIDLKLTPAAFCQVNTAGAASLCSEVSRLAALMDGERAADIYCGAGLFGLTLAKSAPGAEVYGIEINGAAVSAANDAAAKSGIGNAFFLQGDSSELKSKTGIDSLDVAVVDPPRSGLSKKTVAELFDLSPKRIVYVSCNPSTLARDVKSLSEHYELTEVVGVDMFPRTKHIETVVLITRT